MTVYNATRGDKVYIKVGGKKESIKLYSSGTQYVTFYPANSVYYYGVSELGVKNKYNQTLFRKYY